jgi:hypothetical protein
MVRKSGECKMILLKKKWKKKLYFETIKKDSLLSLILGTVPNLYTLNQSIISTIINILNNIIRLNKSYKFM